MDSTWLNSGANEDLSQGKIIITTTIIIIIIIITGPRPAYGQLGQVTGNNRKDKIP